MVIGRDLTMKHNRRFSQRRAGMRLGAMTAVMAFALAVPLSGAVAAPYVVPVPHLTLIADSKASDQPQPHAGEVDPVITGKTVGAGQRTEWERKRKKFLECGLCGKEQAFPEDL